jgi:hypothetical protein
VSVCICECTGLQSAVALCLTLHKLKETLCAVSIAIINQMALCQEHMDALQNEVDEVHFFQLLWSILTRRQYNLVVNFEYTLVVNSASVVNFDQKAIQLKHTPNVELTSRILLS